MNRLLLKKLAIMMAIANSGYLRTVTGNPATLRDALKKPLSGVIVYGAEGGVGDETNNLFDTRTVAASLTRLSSTYPHIGRMYLQLKPNTEYTFWSDQPRYDGSGNNQLALAVNDGKSSSVTSGVNGVWLGQPRTATTDSNGYLTVFSFKHNGSDVWKLAELAESGEHRFMAVEGSYTAETMPEYEAYGYKIPVRFGDVPAGYTQLEYIEGTGTQYIDTGVVLTQGSVIELDTALSASYPVGIAGSRTSATENNFTIYQSNSTAATVDFCNYNLNRIRVAHTDDERVRLRVSKDAVVANGNTYPMTTYTDFTTPGNCYLFYYGGNIVANYGKAQMKCYSFKIWQDTTLVRDMVPAKRTSDNAVGMYDIVTGAFFTNAGTDDFIAGAEVAPNKTINLYTSQRLAVTADNITVNIGAKSATLTAGGISTDVSALQDWEQDFTLAKGDNTVSIGTTVAPSAVEWRYLSSRKGEN